MKIAIVHEMLIKLWGAEKVLLELMHMYPQADVFTLLYDEKKVGNVFPPQRIHCHGPAQWLYRMTKKPRLSLPLMPISVKGIRLKGYDLVISSSSGFAHGVKRWTLNVEHWTKFICYCHSPARYLWDYSEEIQIELGVKHTKWGNYIKIYFIGPLVRLLFWWLRKIDLHASKSPDVYIANSREVQTRIQKYYNRESFVLWPPVECSRFIIWEKLNSTRSYYVLTSALTPFKKVDRAIRVMTELDIPLKVIGDGAQRPELEKIAGPHVTFLWKISDEEIVQVYRWARGFLMPQKEDAGIAPLEAMAAGIPVFGFGQGGLLETSIDGVTWRFYQEDTDESFMEWFLLFHKEIDEWWYDNADVFLKHVAQFHPQYFRTGFENIVSQFLNTSPWISKEK
jgi:glycosyltransferase involved in cell wall biosynthesis